MAVRTLLVLAKLHNLNTRAIDFTLEFPQADVKVPIYLHTPQGIVFENHENVVLKLKKNLYGLKDAGRTWWEHLSDGLNEMGFTQSETDQCVFMRGETIILIYVDDCVILSKKDKDIVDVMNQLRSRYTITDEGRMIEYLGIKLEHSHDTIRMSQPLLIDRIIDAVPGMNKAHPVTYPALPSVILTKDEVGPERRESWNYCSVIGMLNFLVNSSHPELTYAVHQCARFCNDPKLSHERAVKRIIQYLKSTRREGTDGYNGMLFKIDRNKSIEVFVDASFAGDWNRSWSNDPTSVFSRTGYVIFLAGCPIVWLSKLQTEISLSSAEAEYIGLSQSMREVIPLMSLLKELDKILPIKDITPKLHCTIFEDNQSCIELVKCPRLRPRTKHIALKYHHFRSKVKDGLVSVQYVNTKNQIADIFTKALPENQFLILRKKLMGW